MKRKSNQKWHIKSEWIDKVILAVIISLPLSILLCWLTGKNIPQEDMSTELIKAFFTMLAAQLCAWYRYKDNENYAEIDFEGNLTSFSIILKKKLRLQISGKIGNHYIYKTDFYIIRNNYYTVIDLGERCKILVEEWEAGRYRKILGNHNYLINNKE